MVNKKYLGSVHWGYEAKVDEENNIKGRLVPPKIAKGKDGDPSASFIAAAELWNNQKVPASRDSEEVERVQLPIPSDTERPANNEKEIKVNNAPTKPKKTQRSNLLGGYDLKDNNV